MLGPTISLKPNFPKLVLFIQVKSYYLTKYINLHKTEFKTKQVTSGIYPHNLRRVSRAAASRISIVIVSDKAINYSKANRSQSLFKTENVVVIDAELSDRRQIVIKHFRFMILLADIGLYSDWLCTCIFGRKITVGHTEQRDS